MRRKLDAARSSVGRAASDSDASSGTSAAASIVGGGGKGGDYGMPEHDYKRMEGDTAPIDTDFGDAVFGQLRLVLLHGLADPVISELRVDDQRQLIVS